MQFCYSGCLHDRDVQVLLFHPHVCQPWKVAVKPKWWDQGRSIALHMLKTGFKSSPSKS